MVINSIILSPEKPGIPLIILHGLFGMKDNWLTLGKKFAIHRPVHLVDLRNHGDSFHSDEMNLDAMAEDLNVYLVENDISISFLMGHSLGGKVVLRFINEYPEKIKKAIIVDMGLKQYPPHHQNIIKGLQSIDLEIDNSRKKIDEALAEYVDEVDVRQFLMKNIVRNAKNQYKFRINLKGIEKNYLSLLEQTVPSTKITVPILFIKGENSEYLEVQEILTIENYFPNSEMVTIQNAGHWVHAEKPNEFYELVENYLDQ